MANRLSLERFVSKDQEGMYLTLPFAMPPDTKALSLSYDYERHHSQERSLGKGRFTSREEINIRDLGLITLVALALVVPASVSARAVKTPFTNLSETLVGVLDWGDWWEFGDMVHVRGMVQVFECVSSDPRLTGMKTVTINDNWGADGGPWWATSRLETAYGDWEATGTGRWYPDSSISVNEKGHGISGEVERLLYFVTAEPGELGTGYILDPHGE